MNTTLTFDEEFESLYERLRTDEFMNKFIQLSGLSLEKMDIGSMSHKYFTENWADENTVDHNANAHSIGPIHYGAEITKPIMKLEGLYLLHRYLRKDYGVVHADKLITGVVMGDYYVHDSSGVGIQTPYCWAWSTHWLLTNGIPMGQLKSAPPKRAASFIGQVAETCMELSQDFAGAIAPADMLVAYAYFAKRENLSEEEMINHFQTFTHIVNRQFRSGQQCVTEDTEVLTPNGFKKHCELNEGDDIYTWNDGELNIQKVDKVNVYDYDGEMHVYSGRDTIQVVTPNHRILHKKNNSDEYIITESNELIGKKTPLTYPVAMLTDNREDYDISDELLKMCVFILTDGTIRKDSGGLRFFKSPKRWGSKEFETVADKLSMPYTKVNRPDGFNNGGSIVSYAIDKHTSVPVFDLLNGTRKRIPKWMFKLSRRQAKIVIDMWAKLDGYSDDNGRAMKLQCDNLGIADDIQHICFLTGNGSRIMERTISNNKTPTIYVRPYTHINKDAINKDVIQYSGKVWCPSTEDGVVVFRKDGKIFVSGNSLFSNISVFDRDNLTTLFEDMVYPDGSNIDVEYVEYVQDVFMEWFGNGAPNGEPYRFPIVTVNFTKTKNNDIIDRRFLRSVAINNTGKGVFNIHGDETAKLASCCRLINDPARMREFNSDSFGNGGLNLGSARVVTVNLPRIAYISRSDKDVFNQILLERLDDVRDILLTHRNKILAKRIKQGFLKPFDVGLASLNKMFATIGFTGIPEMVEAMGMSIYEKDGIRFVQDVLTFMDDIAAKYSTENGVAFNIEEVPGESATINLADKDKMMFSDGMVKVDFYSNQFVPLTDNVSLTDRIEIEGKLMSTVSGGAMTHINLDEKIENPEIMKKLIEYIFKKGVTHAAINYGFTVCTDCGEVTTGLHDKCPECDGDVTHMTRVVGYFVPVKSWTKTRQVEDFPNRVKYDVGEVV